MTPLQRLGANIRAERERCGMSIANVAEEHGLHANTIGKYERAERKIPTLMLHALSCCFGVPMERFFEGVYE